MNDHLVRAISTQANVRALACVSTETVALICQRQETWPTASVALGRALSGGVLLGALLKGQQRISLAFEGQGPLKKILVEANAQCQVHGTVGNPHVDLPLRNGHFDLPGALGRAGLLTVTKDLGLKAPYQGVVHLVSSKIAEDITYYLTHSEQTPSAMGLTTLVDHSGAVTLAGGFLIQALPGPTTGAIDVLMERIQSLPPLAEFLPHGAAAVLAHLFEGIEYEMLGRQPVHFHCACSRDRVEQGLLILGVKTIEELANQPEKTVIICEFCKERYAFTPDDLHRLATECH
ncbi:Hsp33 family molecular chaperone HslO [Desulfovibrionales bacterium]